MYTILQQGEQESKFYTLQIDGSDFDHFTTLEAACEALENVKGSLNTSPQGPAGSMERWLSAGEEDSDD